MKRNSETIATARARVERDGLLTGVVRADGVWIARVQHPVDWRRTTVATSHLSAVDAIDRAHAAYRAAYDAGTTTGPS